MRLRPLIPFLFVPMLVGCGTTTTAPTRPPAHPHPPRAALAALPVVTILGVQADTASVRVRYAPVAGAADFRMYDLARPSAVKYAGNSQDGTGIPLDTIQWNGLSDAAPHTFIVEAVDRLGPVPPGSLYDGSLNPLPAAMHMAGLGDMQSALGMNAGPTNDGLISTNGLGPPGNAPVVLAQSAPFQAAADPTFTAIPSGPDATQTFFDSFPNNEPIVQTQATDPVAGTMAFTMGVAPALWDIRYERADTQDSRPFIAGHHFMDVLFDGGTPGTNNPPGQAYSSMVLSPQQSFDISGGKVLHVTMEVDSHQDDRRWIGMFVTPARDPLVELNQGGVGLNPNATNTFLDFHPGVGGTTVVQQGMGLDTNGNPISSRICGAAGQAENYCGPPPNNGIGLDNRSRLDLFLTATSYSLWRDGAELSGHALDQPFPAQVKIFFAHYLYHTALERQELQQGDPAETFWINNFFSSDERHWDNMGAEVLPAAVVWPFAGRVTMPAYLPVQAAPTPGPATATPARTGAPTIVPTATRPPGSPTPTPAGIKVVNDPCILLISNNLVPKHCTGTAT